MTNADTSSRPYRLEIFLVSFAALMLEISYTRFVSFKLFYYYTYLIIGLALLGIGCGGVVVAISKKLRDASTDAIMTWSLLLGGASVLVGYVIVARVGIKTLAIWEYSSGSIGAVLKLVLICLALFASFVCIGIIIATLFARRSEQISRLYFADLVGAGLACAVVVAFIRWAGPPSTILFAGFILCICGVRLAIVRGEGSRRLAVGGGLLAALLALTTVLPSVLPEERADDSKYCFGTCAHDGRIPEGAEISKWSPIFRVDVEPVGPGVKLLYHDALPGSGIYQYNGDRSTLDTFDFPSNVRSFAFATQTDPPKNELIIGAAGGHEVLASLFYKAENIDAVELNPVTHSLVTDELADYSGNLDEDPSVNYVHGDGRTYLARSDKPYDLIWYPAPDSYAASNAVSAGAYVLSESYLYTSDAVQESLEHLSRDGLLIVQFGEVNFKEKPNRTTRYVTTARQALRELGIDDPGRHMMVATSPSDPNGSLATILVKRTPFSDAEVERFVDSLDAVDQTVLRYAPGQDFRPTLVSRAITTKTADLDAFYSSYKYDISPIDDDTPFFWHFAKFGDVIKNFADPIDPADPEDTIGERVLLLLLGIAVLLAAVFLLLPFLSIRETWKALPRKRMSAVYFAALGFGFLFFEINLIQKLILFLGYPTYSLTVTLASILIFTGVGALISGRYTHRRDRVVPVLLGAITLLTIFYLFALDPLTDALLGSPLAVRIIFTFVVLAPLGICLGAFMPMGIAAVARLTDHSSEYVAWGWAVNGFASVIGSVLTTILAMTFGFKVVLVLALVTYLIALLALRSLLGTDPVTGAADGGGELPAVAPASAGPVAAPTVVQ
jgi:MFS family permease